MYNDYSILFKTLEYLKFDCIMNDEDMGSFYVKNDYKFRILPGRFSDRIILENTITQKRILLLDFEKDQYDMKHIDNILRGLLPGLVRKQKIENLLNDK